MPPPSPAPPQADGRKYPCVSETLEVTIRIAVPCFWISRRAFKIFILQNISSFRQRLDADHDPRSAEDSSYGKAARTGLPAGYPGRREHRSPAPQAADTPSGCSYRSSPGSGSSSELPVKKKCQILHITHFQKQKAVHPVRRNYSDPLIQIICLLFSAYKSHDPP